MTYFPIKDLVRADYNPRVMPDVEMQSLMKSIETHGFVEPIVVNIAKDRYGIIVGGHQRLTAIEKLIARGVEIKGIKTQDAPEGIIVQTFEIPAFTVELDLEAEKQLNIALNKIHGKFDEDKLYGLIVEMKESPTLPTTGFREDEISRILDRNMDDLDEDSDTGLGLEDIPQSVPGEVYDLGPHRLICGDSTDPSTYLKLLGSEKADMVWTDPPYNVAYKSGGNELNESGKQSIKNDDMSPEQFKMFIDAAFAAMFQNVKQGGQFYICSGWSSYPQFLQSMMLHGFHHSGVIIWVKPGSSYGFNDYKYKHEWIAKAKKPDAKTAQSIIFGWSQGKHTFFGDNEFDVWEMPRKAVQNYKHPTEKPDWLPMRAIRNSTKRGGIILDPFSGSGSVMSACEKTGRRAFMIELDPKFCDVIRARWAKIERAKTKPVTQNSDE